MRMQLDEFAVLGDAITTFGPDAQQKMLLEEMSELQKEICKRWRGADGSLLPSTMTAYHIQQ